MSRRINYLSRKHEARLAAEQDVGFILDELRAICSLLEWVGIDVVLGTNGAGKESGA